MVDAKIIEEWIVKAEEDFEFASINLKEGKTFFAQICFHFQQAAEKYLKSFIIAHELEFRKIHELPLLLKICSSKDSSLEQIREECEYLRQPLIIPNLSLPRRRESSNVKNLWIPAFAGMTFLEEPFNNIFFREIGK